MSRSAGSSKKSVIRAHTIASEVIRPIYDVTLNVLSPSIAKPAAMIKDVPIIAVPTVLKAYLIAPGVS